MASKLPVDAFEPLLKKFLRDNGWPPKCGYYLCYLGADFNTYINKYGLTRAAHTTNPWPKGSMRKWCEQVPGLEVVDHDGEPTLQFKEIPQSAKFTMVLVMAKFIVGLEELEE